MKDEERLVLGSSKFVFFSVEKASKGSDVDGIQSWGTTSEALTN